MAEERIDSYVDRSGFSEDTKFVLSELNKVFEAFKKLDEYKFRIGKSSGMGDLSKVIRETVEEMNKASDANNKLAESEKNRIEVERKLAEAMERLADAEKRMAQESEGATKSQQEFVDSTRFNYQSMEELAEVAAVQEIALQELSRTKRQLKKDFDEGTISAEEYASQLATIKDQQTQLSVSQQRVNLAMRTLANYSQTAAGSLNGLRNELNIALKAYDNMPLDQRNSQTGVELLQLIQNLDAEVKAMEQATGRFQRNVGNYNGAAKIVVEGLKELQDEINRLQSKQSELQNLSKSNPIGFKLQGGSDALNDVNARLQETTKQFQALDKMTSNPQFLNIAGKSGDLQKELGYFRKRLMEMEDAGLKNSKVYDDVKKRLAELTDQIGDTRAEIKRMASDTRQFDLFADSVKFAADTFQTLAGAAALSGASQEDVAKITQKLIAVQTVANGVKGIATQLTEKGTAANKVYAFVQGLVATSMDKTAASAVRLRAALGLLGLVATVVGGVVLALSLLNKKLSETRQAQLNLKEALSESQSEYVKAVSTVKTLESQINAAKEGFLKKEKVVKYYNETIGQTTGQVKNLEQAEKALEKNADAYIKFTLLKAAANVALGKAAEAAFDAQLKFETTSKGDLGAAKSREIGTEATIAANKAKEDAKNAGKAKGEIEAAFNEAYQKSLKGSISGDELKQEEQFLKIFEDLQNQAIALAKKMGFDFFGDLGKGAKKSKDDLDSVIASLRKTAFEAQKARDEAKLADLQRQQDITPFLNERLELIQKEGELQIKMIRDLATYETSQTGITSAEIARLNEDRDRQIVETRLKYFEKASNAAIEAHQKENDYILSQITQLNEEEIRMAKEAADKLEKERERRFNRLSIDQDDELKRLNDLYAKGEISKEEFEKRKKKIEEDYTRYALLIQLDYYKQVVKLSNLAADDKEKSLKEIARLERELSDHTVKYVKERSEEAAEARRNSLADLAAEVKNLGFDLIDGAFERQKNAIQDQIDLLDEKTQKEIEAVNQTVASAAEKEQRIAAIEASGAARRRVLEAEQRRIDQQKARFDRAKAIADVVQQTAIAVMSSFKTDPTGILAAIIGSLGAIQIARVLATPIPKYRFGKSASDNYEGPAIWGDGGKRELKISKDGTAEISGTTPSLTYVKKDDIILPDADKELQMANHNMESVRRKAVEFFVTPQPSVDVSPLASAMSRGFNTLNKTIKNKKEIHFPGLSAGQRGLRYRESNREYFDMNRFN